MEKNNELKNKIKKEIDKSGHPVSLKASLILNKKGWYVKNAPIYFDKRTKTNREIDIVAQKKSNFVKDAFDTLIIECKKQKKNPWVFFKQHKLNKNVFSLNIDIVETTEGRVYDWLDKKGIFKQHYYYDKPLSTYYFVALSGESEKLNRAIFNATNQVLDALRFYISQRLNFFEEYKLRSKAPIFFYPIIVVDGKIFEASMENSKIDVKESSHISLLVERELEEPVLIKLFSPEGYSKPIFSKPFLIDIVKLEYFERFLDNFESQRKEEV